MSPALLGVAITIWVGATLVLSTVRRLARPRLPHRLAPYAAGAGHGRPAGGVLSAASFRSVLAPLARALGERVARLFGVHEALGRRLARIHSPVDPTAFRLRQLASATASLAVAAAAVTAARPHPIVSAGALVGAPLLAFLLAEHRIATRSQAWQRRVFAELPVVAEQLGMLLGAGWSIGAALNRIAERGDGCCARDLGRVCERVRTGLSEADALREWADLSDLDEVRRLVRALAQHHDATDVGRLVAEEARAARREAHRHRIEAIERRGQQVWVPVTLAALVPGSIFLAIPFLAAVRAMSGA